MPWSENTFMYYIFIAMLCYITFTVSKKNRVAHFNKVDTSVLVSASYHKKEVCLLEREKLSAYFEDSTVIE